MSYHTMYWLGPKPTFFKGDVPFSTAACLRARALRRRSDRTEPTEQYLFVNFISLIYGNDPAGLGASYVAKTKRWDRTISCGRGGFAGQADCQCRIGARPACRKAS